LPQGKVTLLLKNCTIYDGTGASPEAADIGIKDDTIVVVGKGPAEAETIIFMAKPVKEGKTTSGSSTSRKDGIPSGNIYRYLRKES
jgi:hypothetical protein